MSLPGLLIKLIKLPIKIILLPWKVVSTIVSIITYVTLLALLGGMVYLYFFVL